MREIFVNGVAFRYKTERDLSLILRHAKEPARLRPLVWLGAEVKQKRSSAKEFNEQYLCRPR